jgi:hypothetical protein
MLQKKDRTHACSCSSADLRFQVRLLIFHAPQLVFEPLVPIAPLGDLVLGRTRSLLAMLPSRLCRVPSNVQLVLQ